MNRPSHNNTPTLRHLLRAHWFVAASPSQNFRAEVWARIDALRHQPATWAAWLRLHFFPVCASALASIVVAAVAAGWAARVQTLAAREQQVALYLGSIDPHVRAGLAVVAFQP